MFTLDDLAALDTDGLAKALYNSIPKLRDCCPDPDALKKEVSDRARQNGYTGQHVVAAISEAGRPGGKKVTDTDFFQKLFRGTEARFKDASTTVRTETAYVQTVFMKVVLSHVSPLVGKVEQAIINKSCIPPSLRAPEWDAFYPQEDFWAIQCGEERHVTYDSTVCRKGEGRRAVHGISVAPRGWLRMGIKGWHGDRDLSTWHKAYHGTAAENVGAIMGAGLVRPKKSMHGAAGAIVGRPVIYCSPSIEYAAHWLYTAGGHRSGAAQPAEGTSSPQAAVLQGVGSNIPQVPVVEMNGTYAQYVFEVRVKPDAYRVQGNTLSRQLWSDWHLEYDDVASSRSLEWLVEDEDHIAVTGVMVRVLPAGQTPEGNIKQREQDMMRHVDWDPGAKRARRAREYGGVDESHDVGSVCWEWNAAPSGGDTTSHCDGAPWKAYDDDISLVIESAYRDYQRVAFIGTPKGAEGPLFIDFGNECGANLERKPEQRRADSDMKQGWRVRAVRRRLKRQ